MRNLLNCTALLAAAAALTSPSTTQAASATPADAKHGVVVGWKAEAALGVAPPGQMPLPLTYNFNGIVHPGERGLPDEATGFRSIADRALSLGDCGGTPDPGALLPAAVRGNSSIAYALESRAGVLDMIHLGNRNLVSGGAWAFEATPDGDNVGTQPAWLGDVDQTDVSIPVDNLQLTQDFVVGVLYHASDGGGTFDLTLEWGNLTETTVTLDAADWFGPSGGTPGPPGPGVSFQGNLGVMWCSSDAIDGASAGPALVLHEAIIESTELAVDPSEFGTSRILTGLRFSNRSNQNAGYGIYAVTVSVQGHIFSDGFETASTGMWNSATP